VKAGVLLDRLADAVSDPEFIQFDRQAVLAYLAIAVLFVGSVAMGFHGSAITRYSGMGTLTNGPVPALLGTGKAIRSDEWAFHTPAILNQVYRADAFATETSAVGPDSSALIANIPVRHFTTIFRPQFWGFFVLPPAFAFSLYWQFKALLLLTGVFSLLLLLTQSSRIAAFGALWYATSAYVQWTYSWASLLPEMTGLFCLVMCALFYTSVGRKPVLLAAAAVVCVTCAVNFALCAYTPHQIPLIWLGVFLCLWWVSVKRRSILVRDHALRRAAAFCGAVVVIAAVMYAFYRDIEPAIKVIANTVYPGRRSSPAGGYPGVMFLSHFFSFWEADGRIPLPQLFGNICECSGFLWLAPVTVLTLRRATPGQHDGRRAYWVLGAFAVLLVAWMTLPVPQLIGRLTLMDQVPVWRTLHVLGLVNVAMAGLALATASKERYAPLHTNSVFLQAAVVFGAVASVLWLADRSLDDFFTVRQVVVAAVYTSVLVVALLRNWFPLLAVSVLVPQLVAFGLVNPLDRGFSVLDSAPLFRFIRSHPDLLRDRWIIYADSHVYPGFFTAAGCDVVTGLKIEPDLKALARFLPAGATRDLINRSGYLIAALELGNAPPRFEYTSLGLVKWRVSPLDPRLRQIGVRYVAFMYEAPVKIASRLKPLTSGSVSGFWLYELPE
jgi:hypothetical protein